MLLTAACVRQLRRGLQACHNRTRCALVTAACVQQVEGHLKLLNTRIKNMLPDDGAQAKLLEDYEDYYDRSIKLRVMENQTLREQLDEQAASVKAMAGQHVKWVRGMWCMTAVALFSLSEMLFPGAIINFVASATLTPGDITSHAAAMALVWWICK